MHKLTKYLHHYLSLICLIIAGIFGVIVFSYNSTLQGYVIFSLSVAYCLWGLIHHWLHEGLSLKITLEYVSFAALGAIIALSIIWAKL